MAEAREKIAKELWEFVHRFGRDNMTWETCSGETQQTYLQEAKFLLEEYFLSSLEPLTDEEIRQILIGGQFATGNAQELQLFRVSYVANPYQAITLATVYKNKKRLEGK